MNNKRTETWFPSLHFLCCLARSVCTGEKCHISSDGLVSPPLSQGRHYYLRCAFQNSFLGTIIFYFLTYYYGYINSTDPNGMKTYLRRDRSCFLFLLRNHMMTKSCQYTVPQITRVWQRALGGTQVITMAIIAAGNHSADFPVVQQVSPRARSQLPDT